MRVMVIVKASAESEAGKMPDYSILSLFSRYSRANR